jgi:hypothetical protein
MFCGLLIYTAVMLFHDYYYIFLVWLAVVVDIPNGYTSDVVSYRETRVAHGGGMADSQPGGLVAGGMADSTLPCHGRFPDSRSLWQIQCCHTMVDYWTQELMADPKTGPWQVAL